MLLSVHGNVLNRVILERLKTVVDARFRDHQAGFRKDRCCTDQIVTLRTIVEQSMKWDLSLCINFVNYEKALNSLDRETLWKLLRHHGIPEKCISMMRSTNDGVACKIIHAGQFMSFLMLKTGVRQGAFCHLSSSCWPYTAIDWVMRRSTENRTILEDPSF